MHRRILAKEEIGSNLVSKFFALKKPNVFRYYRAPTFVGKRTEMESVSGQSRHPECARGEYGRGVGGRCACGRCVERGCVGCGLWAVEPEMGGAHFLGKCRKGGGVAFLRKMQQPVIGTETNLPMF